MSTSPSIGNVGLTVDTNNMRVKVLRPEIMTSVEQVRACLSNEVVKDDDAKKLLVCPTARFTARVIGKNLDWIDSFILSSDIKAMEEARIHTGFGLDIVYVSGNGKERRDRAMERAEFELTIKTMSLTSYQIIDPHGASFERLTHPVSKRDVDGLIEMYRLCFTSYSVRLDETLIQNAAKNCIFIIARDKDGQIVASAIGESLRLGPVTLLEVSEEAAHPTRRIRGAASECARRVIRVGQTSLEPPVVAFWEARMWRNILGIGQTVGLTRFGGVLHQHCLIASPPQFTSLPQTAYGSLAVFYAP